jgi:predicted PurR-regulated permease PerM
MKTEKKGLVDKVEDSHPHPDAEELAGLFKAGSVPLTGIFILLIFYTLYFARSFLLPIVLAMLLNFLLSPLVRLLKRIRIPEFIGAALVMILVIGLIGGGVYKLMTPAAEWMTKVPQAVSKIERKVREFRKPVEQVTKTAQQVERIATVGPTKQQVALEGTSWVDRLFTGVWGFFAGGLVFLILLYFLLASGNLFLSKLVKVMPTWQDKQLVINIVTNIEDHVSTYLLTVTMINCGLGAVVGFGLYLIGMPNASLWGVMIAALNFIPYLGATVGISIIAIVAFLTFPNVGHALLAPGIYLGCATIEGNFLTPIILGKRLTLNPVMVFIFLIFWGWMWGIVGAFLAVPMLAVFKIFCDHIEPLAAVGEFLGN